MNTNYTDPRLTPHALNKIWSYVFALTMRDRASIPGFASEPKSRFEVAVKNADEAVATEKAALAWLGVSDDH